MVGAGSRCSFRAFKEEKENKWEVEVIGSSIDHRSYCVVRREDDRPIVQSEYFVKYNALGAGLRIFNHVSATAAGTAAETSIKQR